MNTKVLIVALLVVALLVFGITFWLSLSDEESEEIAEPQEQEEVFSPGTITAKHQYNDGVHIVAGEVALPTPCYVLEADAIVEVSEPNPDAATIAFTAGSQAEVCAQVITPGRFKVEFNASEDATIRATWNGEDIPLNLIEVGPDEDLAEFEVFIKG